MIPYSWVTLCKWDYFRFIRIALLIRFIDWPLLSICHPIVALICLIWVHIWFSRYLALDSHFDSLIESWFRIRSSSYVLIGINCCFENHSFTYDLMNSYCILHYIRDYIYLVVVSFLRKVWGFNIPRVSRYAMLLLFLFLPILPFAWKML